MKKTFVFLGLVFLAFAMVFYCLKNSYSTHYSGVYVLNKTKNTVRVLISSSKHPSKEEFDTYGNIVDPGEEKFVLESVTPDIEKGHSGFSHRSFKSVHIHDMKYNHIVNKYDVPKLSKLVFFMKNNNYYLDYQK